MLAHHLLRAVLQVMVSILVVISLLVSHQFIPKFGGDCATAIDRVGNAIEELGQNIVTVVIVVAIWVFVAAVSAAGQNALEGRRLDRPSSRLARAKDLAFGYCNHASSCCVVVVDDAVCRRR